MNSLSIDITGDLPVSLATAKQWLRIDHTDDDDAIESLIAEVVADFEHRTGRLIREATGTLKLADFPTGRQAIAIPCPPLRSLTSFDYIDTAEESTSLAAVVNVDSMPGQIYPPSGVSWPQATNKQPHPVTIVFECGAAPTDRQKQIVGCLRIMLEIEFHDLTGSEVKTLEARRDAIIFRHRVRDMRLAGITSN